MPGLAAHLTPNVTNRLRGLHKSLAAYATLADNCEVKRTISRPNANILNPGRVFYESIRALNNKAFAFTAVQEKTAYFAGHPDK